MKFIHLICCILFFSLFSYGSYSNINFKKEDPIIDTTKLDCETCAKAIELYYTSYLEKTEIGSDFFSPLKVIVKSCIKSQLFESDCLSKELKRKAYFFIGRDAIPEYKVSYSSSDYVKHYPAFGSGTDFEDYGISDPRSFYSKDFSFSTQIALGNTEFLFNGIQNAILSQRLNCKDCNTIIDNYFNLAFDYEKNNIFDIKTTQRLKSEALRCAYQQYFTKKCNNKDFVYKMEYLTEFQVKENVTRDVYSYNQTLPSDIAYLLRNNKKIMDIQSGNNRRWIFAYPWSQVKKDSLGLIKNFDIGISTFQKNGLWGCSTDEKIVFISPKYSKLEPFSCNKKNYFLVSKDNLFGILDYNGTEIIPCKFQKIYGIFNSTFEQNKKIYTINESALLYYQQVESSNQAKFGLILNDMKLGDKLYDQIFTYYNGSFIIAKSADKYGFLDPNGNEKSLFKYTNIEDPVFGTHQLAIDGLVIVYENGKAGIVNKNGIEIVAPKYDEIGYNNEEMMVPGFIPFKMNNKYGILNKDGQIIISPIYDEKVRSDIYGNAIVKRNNLYGIMNLSKKFDLPCVFNNIQYFNGNYYVQKNKKYGIYSYSGKEIIPVQYDTILLFSNDKYLIKQMNKNGLAKIDGTIILPPKFDEIRISDLNTFNTRIANKWGMVDANANEIIAVKYDSPFKFENGEAIVSMNGNQFKIDKNDVKINYNKQVYNSSNSYENQSSSKQYSSNQKCNVTFQLPVLPFKYIDNRVLCIYCASRYIPYSKIDVNEYKKSMTLTYVSKQIDEHCEEVGADNNHKASHIIQIGNVCVKKGYFKTTEDAVATIITGNFIGKQVSNYFEGINSMLNILQQALGSSTRNNQANEYTIKLYDNNNTKFCTREHEDRYNRRY